MLATQPLSGKKKRKTNTNKEKEIKRDETESFNKGLSQTLTHLLRQHDASVASLSDKAECLDVRNEPEGVGAVGGPPYMNHPTADVAAPHAVQCLVESHRARETRDAIGEQD